MKGRVNRRSTTDHDCGVSNFGAINPGNKLLDNACICRLKNLISEHCVDGWFIISFNTRETFQTGWQTRLFTDCHIDLILYFWIMGKSFLRRFPLAILLQNTFTKQTKQ